VRVSMLFYLFSVAALVHTFLLALSFARPAGLAEWLLRLLLIGLIADNATLALSGVGLGNTWYEFANVVRYGAHALFLPLLVLAGVAIAARAGCNWAKRPQAWAIALLLALTGVVYGLVTEVAGIEFIAVEFAGHERLVSADHSAPFATIVSNFLLLVIGATIWQRADWPWLFVATLVVFLINGVTAGKPWGIVAGNSAEIIFVLGWLVTLRRFPAAD